MPTLFEIASYARLFRRLRGRRPTVRETLRFFDAAPRDDANRPINPAPRRKRSRQPIAVTRRFPQSLAEF